MRVALICRGLLALCGIFGLHTGADADDASLLRELRSGAVLLMRHTQTTAGVGDPPGWRLGRCESQRNLDAGGIAHARRIGQWFACHQLRVTAVRNSPWCRARDTATLAFGRHDDWAALSNIFEDRSGADAQAAAVRQYVQSREARRAGGAGVARRHHQPHRRRSCGLATGESVVVRAGASPTAPLQVIGRLVVP